MKPGRDPYQFCVLLKPESLDASGLIANNVINCSMIYTITAAALKKRPKI
jgi:hypothetical protein